MDRQLKIYKENYIHLPERFQKKIEYDLDYLVHANIPGLKRVYLFGSCARGDVRSTSDVDLMILTEERLSDRTLAANIRWTLDDPLDGVRTDVSYTYEGAAPVSQVFKKTFDRDKRLILEVCQ